MLRIFYELNYLFQIKLNLCLKETRLQYFNRKMHCVTNMCDSDHEYGSYCLRYRLTDASQVTVYM